MLHELDKIVLWAQEPAQLGKIAMDLPQDLISPGPWDSKSLPWVLGERWPLPRPSLRGPFYGHPGVVTVLPWGVPLRGPDWVLGRKR